MWKVEIDEDVCKHVVVSLGAKHDYDLLCVSCQKIVSILRFEEQIPLNKRKRPEGGEKRKAR